MSTKSSRSVPGLDSLPLDPRIAIENFAESVAPRSFVGSFTRAASTGEVSVSGIGFRPRAVIMLSRFLSVMDHAHSIGFAWAEDTSFALYQTVAKAVDTTNDLVALSDGSTHVRASLSSFDSDGFTLDYSQADASSVSIYLCIG